MSPDRLRALARERAYVLHWAIMDRRFGRVDRGIAVAYEGHVWTAAEDRGFSTCPHPDCVLVRTDPPVSEGQFVEGYDAKFWNGSYKLLREAIMEHLSEFVHDTDVAEEAILIDAVTMAGERLKAVSEGCTEPQFKFYDPDAEMHALIEALKPYQLANETLLGTFIRLKAVSKGNPVIAPDKE